MILTWQLSHLSLVTSLSHVCTNASWIMTDVIYTNIGSSAIIAVNPHKYVPSNADSILHKYTTEYRNISPAKAVTACSTKLWLTRPRCLTDTTLIHLVSSLFLDLHYVWVSCNLRSYNISVLTAIPFVYTVTLCSLWLTNAKGHASDKLDIVCMVCYRLRVYNQPIKIFWGNGWNGMN